MKNKDRIKFLLGEGLSIQTVANLSESQLIVLSEKFKKNKKEETKEQVTKVTEPAKTSYEIKGPGDLPNNPTGKGYSLEKKPDGTVKATPMETEMTEDVTVDKNDAGAGEYSQDPHQVQAPDGMGDEGDATIDKEEDLATESVIREKFESQAQQNFFWGKCNTTRGVQKQKWCQLAKEFSDKTTKKDYEKMPEKLHPEKTVKYKKKKTNENLEKFLEDKIVSILENKVKPRMKKSDLVKLVKEKSESMILSNPKKLTMFSDEAPKMKTPVGKLFSIGKKK
jgi:hypothetical protein